MHGITPALVGFVAGDIALQYLEQLPESRVFFVLLLLAALAGAARPASRRRLSGTVVLALAFVAGSLAGFSQAGLRAHSRLAEALATELEGRDLHLTGVVATLPVAFEGGSRFTFEVERAQLVPGSKGGQTEMPAAQVDVPRNIGLSWYGADERLLPAQRWETTVRLRRPQATLNPAGFDAEAWLFEQDVRAIGSVRSGTHDPRPKLLDALVWRFNPLVDRTRARLREKLVASTQGLRHATVIVALVMGDQSGIGDES